ncbi:hypothetical protein HK413_12995 [Mucilaginibacter sp. S1162]|uniref:Uracil-DNA glycosylase-like domain-containing protein n=1 Tax=Mucilaginibacter humi TaxID=2732510 RepID=A0ABX1W3F8_9SPHI|nr:hypothetical protein [Mucilaginibacter humi]NNU34742.1 hypothetical protein [Mucilaginibacter humi]
MRSENPAALRFILEDDIYLLQSDKAAINQTPVTPVEISAPAVIPSAPAAATATLPETAATAAATLPNTPEVTVTGTPAVQFNYMGSNKKRFLIITHYPTENFIAADHLAALQNILKRLAYEIDDVAILNLAKAAITTVTDIVAYFKPEKLLILGEAAVPAGMGVPPVNQYKKMKNGVFLRSFSFDEMMSSTDNKKVFWEQMKNL